jgi:hypothetical protein
MEDLASNSILTKSNRSFLRGKLKRILVYINKYIGITTCSASHNPRMVAMLTVVVMVQDGSTVSGLCVLLISRRAEHAVLAFAYRTMKLS